MKRILLIIAVVAATAFLSVAANTSEASPPPNKGLNKGVNVNVNVRGARVRRSYAYYAPYSCYLFFDPISRQWYFYSDRLHQFLPLSLILANPPLTNGAPFL